MPKLFFSLDRDLLAVNAIEAWAVAGMEIAVIGAIKLIKIDRLIFLSIVFVI